MLLKSERISVRDMQASDADFMLELLNSQGFINNVGDRQLRTTAQVIDKINTAYTTDYPNYGLYTVVDNQTNALIGTVSYLKREHLAHDDIGYAFLPQFFGKGYAFEATKLLLDYVISQGKTCVFAVVKPTNTPSIKLLEKLNFVYAGETLMPNETIPISKYQYTVTNR
jgi:RimJ/RimL family protein N-acetyltransferase